MLKLILQCSQLLNDHFALDSCFLVGGDIELANRAVDIVNCSSLVPKEQ